MSLAVVDASVLVVFYATNDPRRSAVQARLHAGDALFAPALVDAEVVSALRGLARADGAIRRAAPAALVHLAGLAVRRMPLAPLLTRIWELRENITPYEAAYVALAERLGGTLITCDAKLRSSGGARCAFDVIV